MKTDAQTITSTFMSLYSSMAQEPAQPFTAEHDEEVIRYSLGFAEKLFPQNGIMLCPISHSNYRYTSASMAAVFGHEHADLARMDLPDYFALVHPDDRTALQQCLAAMRSLAPIDPEKNRAVIHYRVRDQYGNYCLIRDEKIAIRTNANRYLHLMLFTRVPAENQKLHTVCLEVFKNVKGNYVKVHSYHPVNQDKNITPRQNDIARLILKGLSNREIADKLHVSIFTVKNHKQMLYKKVNVRNSVELANYVRSMKPD
jgi:DNA-binding CsgD family transcriptional regulator